MKVGGPRASSTGAGQAWAWAISGALVAASPLLLLGVDTKHHRRPERQLRQDVARCGKAGVRSIGLEAIVCRNGKVVFRRVPPSVNNSAPFPW